MNTLTTTFLMAFLTVTLVTTGKELGGAAGAWIAFAFALAMHAISYRFSDGIILRMHGAKEILPDEAPWLYRVVQELTYRMQMPMPKLYVLRRRTPTTLATGRDEKHAAVAVTEDMQILGEVKLRGMLARELSGIKNRDRLAGAIGASVTGAISVLVNIGE
jgi:heat shock protein HtpX